MTVVKCGFPGHSALDGSMVAAAFFHDSYRAPLSKGQASMADIFFNLFGHHPGWVKRLLMLRNRIAAPFGLDVPKAADIIKPVQKARYQVGDIIGPWPIFSLSDDELIVGRDNKHLDFRLSLLRDQGEGTASVTVSTVCDVHNLAGKAYLFFIIPFHKWGVKQMMARAVSAGRL